MITFLIGQKIPINESPAQFISLSESLKHNKMHLHKQIDQKNNGKPRPPGDLRHPSRINCSRRSTSHQFQHRQFSENKSTNA